MEDLLRNKGLYRIASGQESKPKDEDKQSKWENKKDQARGLIGMFECGLLRSPFD